jgi:rubrerythrin
MGVFERAKSASGLTGGAEETTPYVCLACGAAYEVQHHRCPNCESFDIRYSKWVQE